MRRNRPGFLRRCAIMADRLEVPGLYQFAKGWPVATVASSVMAGEGPPSTPACRHKARIPTFPGVMGRCGQAVPWQISKTAGRTGPNPLAHSLQTRPAKQSRKVAPAKCLCNLDDMKRIHPRPFARHDAAAGRTDG